MGLQSSDRLMVSRGGTWYEETFGNRSNIENSDFLLAEATATTGGRTVGQKYKCTYGDWTGAVSYTDIHSANYAVPASQLTFTYGQSSNNTNAFSVFEVQVEVTSSGTNATGELYIGVRNTAPTSYYGDLPIAAVQILQSNGTSFRSTAVFDCDWNFGLGNTTQGYADWGTTTTQITSSTTSPASHTYSTIGTSATARRFSYTASGTSSANVGAAKGISTSTYAGNMTNILPVGTANVSQSGSNGYLFQECSGSSTNDITWLGLDGNLNLYNGDRIRVCYFGGGNGQTSSNGLQTSNCIFLRFV